MTNLVTFCGRPKDLIMLAGMRSQTSRRALLKRMTKWFLDLAPVLTSEQIISFGEIFYFLATKLEQEDRKELAESLASTEYAPYFLVNTLVRECTEIAEPILKYSLVIKEDDIYQLALSKDQGYLRAIASRSDLTIRLIDVLIERGDEITKARLSDNKSVQSILPSNILEINPLKHETRRRFPSMQKVLKSICGIC